MTTREQYEEIVSFPGKFEAEQPYVPYFWNQYLDGCYDGDDGEILSFVVSAEDRVLFPELELGQTIKLSETDSGFVMER